MARVTIALNLLLVAVTAVIIGLLSPAFLRWEYARLGFTPSQLRLATETLAFVTGSGRAPAGLYLPSELSHLRDVKNLIAVVYSLNFLGVLCLFVSVFMFRSHFTRSLGLAGGITVLFGAIVFPLTLLAWNRLFVAFHQIFFPQGNWAFLPDSTLIRLFPEQLWVEAFTAAAIGLLAVGLAYLGFGRLLSHRQLTQ